MHCNQILNNIALTQSSIAHLLSEEAEKLSKIVALSTDPEQLLSANDFVIGALQTSTELQNMIFCQLQALLTNLEPLSIQSAQPCTHKKNTAYAPSSSDYYYCQHCNCYHPY